MKQSELEFITTLRQSSHYIEQHRGKTIVIYIPGDFSNSQEALKELSQDVGLLNSLGIKTVIALGAGAQLDTAFANAEIHCHFHKQFRITTSEQLPLFVQTIATLRTNVEAIFSQSTGQHPKLTTLVSGNWVIAQPKGVIDGIDYQHTGRLRKINHDAIVNCLNANQVALLTPLAYSLTGEVFNLNTLEQACEIANAIEADKLMIFASDKQLKTLPKQMSTYDLSCKVNASDNLDQQRMLQQLSLVNNVNRIHLIDQREPSSLLMELFSTDGSGTLIFSDRYHQLRTATIEDVGGILSLIEPLEQEGILVKRSRERLELEIENFIVIERDQLIIGCAALYPVTLESQELACLAVDPTYQGQQLGEELLKAIESQAKKTGATQLFLLTTHTHHWFIEHGFEMNDVAVLPEEKQTLYNFKRQSKVLVKTL